MESLASRFVEVVKQDKEEIARKIRDRYLLPVKILRRKSKDGRKQWIEGRIQLPAELRDEIIQSGEWKAWVFPVNKLEKAVEYSAITTLKQKLRSEPIDPTGARKIIMALLAILEERARSLNATHILSYIQYAKTWVQEAVSEIIRLENKLKSSK
ncbi:hypothetical protein J7K74_03790 [Candidatus Woesearchaeota archaeon]|nr:hypothetical protein [Candidatus Woesearchaeota archaeon]